LGRQLAFFLTDFAHVSASDWGVSFGPNDSASASRKPIESIRLNDFPYVVAIENAFEAQTNSTRL
jgi:hypothetical protein